jgi:Tryptophan synthase beta chain
LAIALSAERAIAGRFGPYGGRYVPETLVAALDELATLYDAARSDPGFWAEFERLLASSWAAPRRFRTRRAWARRRAPPSCSSAKT